MQPGSAPDARRIPSNRTAVFTFFALLRVALRELASRSSASSASTDQSYKQTARGSTSARWPAWPTCSAGCRPLGLAWVELGHEEADDVIASLVHLDPQRPPHVLSTDRDYLELVTEQVQMLNTAMRSGHRLLAEGSPRYITLEMLRGSDRLSGRIGQRAIERWDQAGSLTGSRLAARWPLQVLAFGAGFQARNSGHVSRAAAGAQR